MPDALTLSEVRAQVLSEADWAPTQSDSFLAELDRYIWLASQRLVTLVPGLLHDRETLYLQPPAQYNASVASDRVSVVPGDRLVLSRPTTSASRTAWIQDGRWDSRNLWVKSRDTSEYYRFQAHEWWTDQEAALEYVSLDKMYPVTTSNSMLWWVYTDPYALQDDVVSVVEASIFDPLTAQKWPMKGITEAEMERLWRPGPPSQGTQAKPLYWCPGPRKRRRPLQWTPQVSNTGTWEATGDDTGQRDYRLTVCWGRRDIADLDTHGNMRPIWESPPTPASAKITATAGAGGAISVTTPHIDYIAHYMGIPTTGRVSNFRSGYYIRVYERQYTDTESTPLNDLAGYYLIGEVSGTGPFLHTGIAQRVYEVPLRPNQDIPTIRVWPHPNQRYELDLRVVRRPAPVTVTGEVIPVPPDASELLILDARRRLANKMGRNDIGLAIEAEIQRRAGDVNRANLQHAGVVLERGMCDASTMNGRGGVQSHPDIDDIFLSLYRPA